MRLSAAGANLIATFEGFRTRPYRDTVGVWTIGYGSTKGVGPRTPPVTRAAAMGRLIREVTATYGAAVTRVRVAFNQNQYDALCSFTYNVGPGGVATTTGVGRALRRRDWRGAGIALMEWVRAGGRVLEGLVRRRRLERALFLRPVANPDPYRGLPKHELQMAHKIEFHRKKAIVAPTDSEVEKDNARWRDWWKAKARAQMKALRRSATVTDRDGGWAKDGRGRRYQLLKRAVEGKPG